MLSLCLPHTPSLCLSIQKHPCVARSIKVCLEVLKTARPKPPAPGPRPPGQASWPWAPGPAAQSPSPGPKARLRAPGSRVGPGFLDFAPPLWTLLRWTSDSLWTSRMDLLAVSWQRHVFPSYHHDDPTLYRH